MNTVTGEKRRIDGSLVQATATNIKWDGAGCATGDFKLVTTGVDGATELELEVKDKRFVYSGVSTIDWMGPNGARSALIAAAINDGVVDNIDEVVEEVIADIHNQLVDFADRINRVVAPES